MFVALSAVAAVVFASAELVGSAGQLETRGLRRDLAAEVGEFSGQVLSRALRQVGFESGHLPDVADWIEVVFEYDYDLMRKALGEKLTEIVESGLGRETLEEISGPYKAEADAAINRSSFDGPARARTKNDQRRPERHVRAIFATSSCRARTVRPRHRSSSRSSVGLARSCSTVKPECRSDSVTASWR
jgi:hypothetical protein